MMECEFEEVFQCLYYHAETAGLKPKEERDIMNIPFIRDKHSTQIIEDMIMEIFKILDKEVDIIRTLGYPDELKILFKEWEVETLNCQ